MWVRGKVLFSRSPLAEGTFKLHRCGDSLKRKRQLPNAPPALRAKGLPSFAVGKAGRAADGRDSGERERWDFTLKASECFRVKWGLGSGRVPESRNFRHELSERCRWIGEGV